jgi:hypothetical protein
VARSRRSRWTNLVCASLHNLGFLRPGYSLVSEPVSGLGVGTFAPAMNASFIFMGLLIFVGVISILAPPQAEWDRRLEFCSIAFTLTCTEKLYISQSSVDSRATGRMSCWILVT